MNYLENYYLWRTNEFFDSQTKEEVSKLDEKTDLEEIKDRFAKDITYELNGMTGKMEAGPNRVNIYTIGKMTAAYVIYLVEKYGRTDCTNNGVVVCFDSRKNGILYAKIVSRVLSGFGIKVYLQNRPVPSAFASFSVKYFGAVASIMITSNNENFEFNGLKFYNKKANEIDDNEIKKLNFCLTQITFYNQINFMGDESKIISNDYSDDYLKNVLKQATNQNFIMNNNIKIAYSSLFGVGSDFVKKTLVSAGFKSVGEVDKHRELGRGIIINNGSILDEKNRETVIKFASELNLDLAIMTSSNCEKIVIAIKRKNEYLWLSSTEMSILLFDYLIQKANKSKLNRQLVFKTLLTTNLMDKISENFGIELVKCGEHHKYISENVANRDNDEIDNYYQMKEFMLAVDNDFGFWINKYSKERDGVLSSLIFAEMTSYYKYFGKDLFDRLAEIYTEYGYFCEEDEEFEFEDADEKMSYLRQSSSPFMDTIEVVDYIQKSGFSADNKNIITYRLKNNSSVTFVADTENQKIKIHYSIYGENERFSRQLQQRCHLVVRAILDI